MQGPIEHARRRGPRRPAAWARPLRRASRAFAIAATFGAISGAASCDAPPCDDRCGLGTQCVDGKCVVDDAAGPETTGVPEGETPDKPRRKGRRRRSGSAAGDEAEGDVARPVYDDSAIPRYDPKRVQTIGEGSGSERLSDRTVRQHLDRIEPAINRCIEEYVEAGVDVGSGQVSFQIGIEPSGKVWGITAAAPAALKTSGVVACMRKKIHAHRFPSWDGPAMGVDYSFEVR